MNKSDEMREKNSTKQTTDWLFQQGYKANGKKSKKGFTIKLIRQDFWRILYVSFLYIIRTLPIWIVPLVTTDIINVITLPGQDFVKHMIIDGIILFVIIVQNIPISVVHTMRFNHIVREMNGQIKSDLLRKLQRLSITYFKEIEEGKIQSKFLRDVENIDAYYRILIGSLIPSIINTIIAAALSIWQSPIVTLFFLAVVPLNVIIATVFNKPIKKYSYIFRKENELLSARLTSSIQMMQLTKSHGLLDIEEYNVTHKIQDVTKAGFKLDKKTSYFGSSMWVVNQLLSASCLFFCAFLAIKGIITPGSVFLFQTLFISLSSSILGLINLYPSIITGKEAVRSVSEIINAGEDEENVGKQHFQCEKGEISFCDVSYHYPHEEKNVIDHFNLDVASGQCIAFVGASGCGKSTIMNLVIGLLSPSEGKILIDGQQMSQISMRDYRQYLSVVPQNSILFSGSIKENITYGLSSYTDEQLNQAVEQANISEFLPSLTNGLDTIVGEHGDKLSGGQKQRISIARALIRNPKILILDEATSALDNISEFHVQQAINNLVQKRTTFIVAHRLSTIRNADKIVVMENGRIVETGTYDELMALNGKFTQLEKLNRLHNN